jgi:formylglycine-generating enzyme required for sulfatase activity
MAVDFYLAIGMTADAKTIIDAYPENAELTAAAPKLKPARSSRTWVGVGIFSFICLLLLGAGAWGLSAFLPSFSRPTQTISPATTDPVASLTIPVTGDLPSAEGMVQVNAGSYEVGLSPADDYHVAPTTVPLNDFWLDQYLVTNAQFQEYMTKTGAPPPVSRPGEGSHPVIGVTWDQALAYCQWANKRLPKEAEWEAAGRGAGVTPQLYPWGNDVTAEGQALRLPDQDTYAVGTQSFNKSPFGVFDMVGNVWEWVGEPYAGGQEGSKVLRGGRYGLPINDLAYRLTIAPGDTRYIKYAGFRCAADQVR